MLCESLLEPCAENAACRAEQSKLVSAVVKVKSVDLRGTEIFEVVEVGEFGGNFTGSEEKLERFPREFDTGGQGIVGELFKAGKCGSGLTVIKDEPAFRGPGGDVAHGRTEGFEGEIRNNTEPCEERRGIRIKAGVEELRRKGLVFEVYRDEA
jgi:hypothetical protein